MFERERGSVSDFCLHTHKSCTKTHHRGEVDGGGGTDEKDCVQKTIDKREELVYDGRTQDTNKREI